MRNKIKLLVLLGILTLLYLGCSIEWTKAIRFGGISQNQFIATVDIEILKGLIFLPVRIEGNEYRFLFDSGAPFSISKRLQKDFSFEVVSKGNIKDSDHNRKQVNWVQVDSINIGHISFTNQSAFIGDFDENPIFKCLKIDGIVGSNLIRHCNWTIDQKQKSLTLFTGTRTYEPKGGITIPFKTDYQYNLFVDLNLGPATIRDVLVDYGSNGYIALNNQIFTTIKSRNILKETLIEKGVTNRGIVGKAVNLKREIAYSDSVSIDSIILEKVLLQTGKTVSIGNRLLSRFIVTIDWENQNLHLLRTEEIPKAIRITGFSLGYSASQGVFVQSVVEPSDAFNKGVRPNMKVAGIDELEFQKGIDYCDYVFHELGDKIVLRLIDSRGKEIERSIKKTILTK